MLFLSQVAESVVQSKKVCTGLIGGRYAQEKDLLGIDQDEKRKR